MENPFKGLRTGRIVDVVSKNGTTHEPAIVTKVYAPTETIAEGTIDCYVFGLVQSRTARSVKFGPGYEQGTWHWLEYAD